MIMVMEAIILEQELDIVNEFRNIYPKRVSVLRRYEEANGEDFRWETVTNSKLYYFVEYLKNNVSTNSARTYAAMLKSFINLFLPKFKGINAGWEKILSIREVETTSITLDEVEVDKIIKYALDNSNGETNVAVASTFAICCITGTRWDDAYKLKDIDLSGHTFKYISDKTDIIAEIPVSPVLRQLVGLVKKFSLAHYNRTIRSICGELKINSDVTIFKGGVALRGAKYEFVSSHTARRSFATNLYKRGADLEIISKMMGHATYEQTKRYINSDLDNLDDNIKSFFNR